MQSPTVIIRIANRLLSPMETLMHGDLNGKNFTNNLAEAAERCLSIETKPRRKDYCISRIKLGLSVMIVRGCLLRDWMMA